MMARACREPMCAATGLRRPPLLGFITNRNETLYHIESRNPLDAGRAPIHRGARVA